MEGDIANGCIHRRRSGRPSGMGGAASVWATWQATSCRRAAQPSAAAGQTATLFIGIAFAEALGIFSFLVALLLMFAV